MNIPMRFNLSPALAGAGLSFWLNPHYVSNYGIVRGVVLHALVAAVCHAVSNVSMRVLGTSLGLMSAGCLGLGGGYWAGQYAVRHYVIPQAHHIERHVRQLGSAESPIRQGVLFRQKLEP